MTYWQDEDEAEIRGRIDAIVEGLRHKDAEALRSVYADDIVSFDIDPPLQHRGIEAKLANWKHLFDTFQTIDYEIRDLTVTTGGDLAFTHGFGRVGGTLATGEPVEGLWVRLTNCFRRVDGAWVIVHDQVSVPLDMASGLGVVDLEP